jgi:hypothetical protein
LSGRILVRVEIENECSDIEFANVASTQLAATFRAGLVGRDLPGGLEVFDQGAQRSARALEQVGCRIGFEGGGGGWLEQLVGKATLLPVNAVVGDHTKFDDADARLVAGMSKLRILSLANTRITDKGLAEIRGLNSLTTLNLEHTKISDDGLRHIAQFRKLKSLNLAGTAISEAGLAHLAPLRELVHLDLSETRVGDEHPESLPTFGALVMLSL